MIVTERPGGGCTASLVAARLEQLPCAKGWLGRASSRLEG